MNGKIAEIGQIIEETDKIEFEGKIIQKEEKEYYIINKPLGYICTNDEQFGRDKVIDLIKTNKRLVTVGRLDMYTTGALIITNDGELVNNLIHPKKQIEKEYYVTIKGKISDEDLERLKTGIEIDTDKGRYKTNGAKVKILGVDKEKNISRLSVIITEGKNRQVRKMFKEINHPILALHRAKVAGLDVKQLKPGEYRKIPLNIVKTLKI